MSDTPSTPHRHQHDCPETAEHADSPIYDEAAWASGLAPLPAEQVA